MDYNFLKKTRNGLEEYVQMTSQIEKFAEEEIDRGHLGKGTKLYEVRESFRDVAYIEIEPITFGRENWTQEGVYIQIHTSGRIPKKIKRILYKRKYISIPSIAD